MQFAGNTTVAMNRRDVLPWHLYSHMARTKSVAHVLPTCITADFREEKLIPLVHLTRKLVSCNFDEHINVLQQLARIFQSDDVSFSLMDILVAGFCQKQIYEKIPAALYDEMDSMLPSDKELSLKDSVFESRLVEEQEDPSEKGQEIEKKKLPLTLLRIPTDLQCHLFHFLYFKELTNVQNVCRALCIAARNPSAVRSLECQYQRSINCPFQNECYSQPKILIISPFCGSFVGNEKWANHVVDLHIDDYDGIDVKFRKLEECVITRSSSILLNGSITSYHTLKQLTLGSIKLTEDIIDHIRKFENLERLSLKNITTNPDWQEHSAPISLPKLKCFSYQIRDSGFRDLQRFLIGSNAETVFKIDADGFYEIDTSVMAEFPKPDMSAVKQFKVSGYRVFFFEAMSQWLNGIQDVKVFDKLNINIDTNLQESRLNVILPPVIAVCQHAKQSTLKVHCDPNCELADCKMDEVVNMILNAPFGTFAEIKMEMIFLLLYNCDRRGGELYIEDLLDTLDLTISGEENEEIVKNLVEQAIDDAEKWIKPWLLFNESRIKQIGLHSLNIEFCCNLKPDYNMLIAFEEWTDELETKASRLFQPIFNEMIDGLLDERVNRWDKCGRQCITVKKDGQGFTVTLSL